MKKKSLKDLKLNKKVISNLDVTGGSMPESDPNTYRCPTAIPNAGCGETIHDPLPMATCGCITPTTIDEGCSYYTITCGTKKGYC